MSSLSLTQGNVKTTLIRFAIPFLAASMLQFLYGAADLIIVGQFSDAANISAVGTGTEVMQTVTGLVTGLATGGTILIGHLVGARRPKDVTRAIGTIFTLFTLIAIGLTAALTLSTNLIVSAMRVPTQAIVPARQYLFICACGSLFITGYNTVSGILRGLGDSKRPMIFVAIACFFNIVGDLLLVGVFHMGAAGAAIATVAAQALSLLLSLLVLRKGNFPFAFRRANFRIRRDAAGNLIRLGAPVAIQNSLVSFSFLIITAIVNNMGILPQAAAVGVVERVLGFAMLAPFAFLSAISAMGAQNIGAHRPDRAMAALRYGIVFCLAVDMVMFLLIQFFPQAAASLFTPDVQVIGHSALYLRTYSIDCILVSFVFCLNGFFGGCGRTGFAMFNSLVSTFAVRVPVVFLISLLPGVTLLQIGLAAPAASVVQIALQLWYLRSGRWKQRT